VPIGRAGEAAEVAQVIAFLAGPLSSYMHGTLVDVSGGR
jgi:3-oxoacyl-[acyl-carrier protein] reductase